MLKESFMSACIHRYLFKSSVPMEEVEAALVLAIYAIESIYGAADTRLEASHAVDSNERKCVIDARTELGRDFSRVFLGFVTREFGDDSFEVERVEPTPTASVA